MGGAPPPGAIASLMQAHPELTPFLVTAGAASPQQANDVQSMTGMTNYLVHATAGQPAAAR